MATAKVPDHVDLPSLVEGDKKRNPGQDQFLLPGGKILPLSDSQGFIQDPDGIDQVRIGGVKAPDQPA